MRSDTLNKLYDDGHTIVIGETAPGEDWPEVGKATCPGAGPCMAGSASCVEWDNGCHSGVLLDEDGDEVGDCPACKGTGMSNGEHECWVAEGHNDNWETLLDSLPQGEHVEPGVYRLLVGPDPLSDQSDYHVYLKLGARIGPASPVDGGDKR